MKTSLTTAQALATLEGIGAIIKGYEAIVPGPDGKDRAVPAAYKIDAQTAMRLRMNFKNLEPVAKSFDEARTELITRLSNGGTELNAKDNKKAFEEFLAETNKMATDTLEVDLYKVDLENLLANNDNILAAVMKIGPILNEAALTD